MANTYREEKLLNGRQCHICGALLWKGQYCKHCTYTLYNKLPDASKMTKEEKFKELDMWNGVLEIPWEKFVDRISALLGRPVKNYELIGGVNNIKTIIEADYILSERKIKRE